MRSWKKQLKAEFDKSVPSLKPEIKNAPINSSSNEQRERIVPGEMTAKTKNRFWGKGLFVGATCVAMIAIIFTVLGIMGVFNPAVTPSSGDRFVYMLEINPSVAFVTDENGKVIDVRSFNEDSDIVLSDDETLKSIQSSNIADALTIYVDTATKLGYLDLSDKTAVRLTTTDETNKDIFAESSKSLQNYFMNNGIFAVVVENSVSIEDFCSRLGMTAQNTLSDLTDTLDALSLTVGERISQTIDSDYIQELYDTYIMNMQTFELIKEELSDNFERISECIGAIKEIGILSLKILTDKDNPYLIPADYWTIKKYGNKEYTEEFSALMKQMDDLIADYNQNYGVEIVSLDGLRDMLDALKSFDLDDFTFDEFKNSFSKYISVLKSAGFSVDVLEKISAIPNSYEQYLEQFKLVTDELYNSKVKKYKDIYEKERDAISTKDYNDFISQIVNEYGSLENFWNNK